MTSSLSGFTPTSKGTLKRGGIQGDYIPKGYRAGQLQQFTPDQMELFQSLFSHAGPDSFLSKLAGGDESFFEEMEAPAHRQFQQYLGQLGSRFTGTSGPGGQAMLSGQRSSGFQNTATSAASNFAQDLASNRQNLQRQALSDLMGLSNSLLGQRPYLRDVVEKKQSPNFFAQAAGKLGGAIPGAAFGALKGGGQGAAEGAAGGFSLFNDIGKLFGFGG